MSKHAKTLNRVLRGNADTNLRFDDIRRLLVHLGFAERIRGDHHIFSREDVAEILNIQPRNGQAKPYQVKQIREVIVSRGLAGELEPEVILEADAPDEHPDQAVPEDDPDDSRSL